MAHLNNLYNVWSYFIQTWKIVKSNFILSDCRWNLIYFLTFSPFHSEEMHNNLFKKNRCYALIQGLIYSKSNHAETQTVSGGGG